MLSTPQYYSGQTVISGGYLNLVGPGSVSNSSVEIGTSGRLDISGAAATVVPIQSLDGSGSVNLGSNLLELTNATGAFSGSIQGQGGLVILSGSETLTGASSLAGAFTVNGGVLEIDGSAPNAALEVNAGGTVRGTGLIGGSATVAAGGAISSLSAAPLQIRGNLSLGAGSTYDVAANANGQSGLVTVGGTLSIGASTVEVLAAPGSYARRTSYLIISATGGLTGQFSNVLTDMVFLEPSLSYSGNSVFLTLINKDIPFASVAATANQRAVAAGVDGGGHTGAVYSALLLQSDAGARQAFDALSGEAYATAATVELDQSHYMRDAIFDRLRQADDGHLAGAGPSASEPVPGSAHLTVWAQALGAWSRSSFQDNGSVAGSRSDTTGGVLGVDGLFHGWRAGFALGETNSDLNIDARSSQIAEDSTHLALYAAGSVFAGFKLGGGFDYAWSSLSAHRTVTFPGFNERDSASYHSGDVDAFAEAAYPFHAGSVNLDPYANLAYVQVSTDGFNESGGASSLRAGSTSPDDVFSVVGIRAGVAIQLGRATLLPYVDLGWRHAFNDGQTVTPLLLTDDSASFSIHGATLDQDTGNIGAGLTLKMGDAKLNAAYQGEISNRWQDHQAKLAFYWTF